MALLMFIFASWQYQVYFNMTVYEDLMQQHGNLDISYFIQKAFISHHGLGAYFAFNDVLNEST